MENTGENKNQNKKDEHIQKTLAVAAAAATTIGKILTENTFKIVHYFKQKCI